MVLDILKLPTYQGINRTFKNAWNLQAGISWRLMQSTDSAGSDAVPTKLETKLETKIIENTSFLMKMN